MNHKWPIAREFKSIIQIRITSRKCQFTTLCNNWKRIILFNIHIIKTDRCFSINTVIKNCIKCVFNSFRSRKCLVYTSTTHCK